MQEILHIASAYSVLAINLMALVVIVFGTVEAFWSGLGVMIRPADGESRLSRSYVRFGRWLVAGLTFQLAADVIETATTSTANGWYDIGRLAAVAVIRTFLSYFLERDMRAMTEVSPSEPAPPQSGASRP